MSEPVASSPLQARRVRNLADRLLNQDTRHAYDIRILLADAAFHPFPSCPLAGAADESRRASPPIDFDLSDLDARPALPHHRHRVLGPTASAKRPMNERLQDPFQSCRLAFHPARKRTARLAIQVSRGGLFLRRCFVLCTCGHALSHFHSHPRPAHPARGAARVTRSPLQSRTPCGVGWAR